MALTVRAARFVSSGTYRVEGTKYIDDASLTPLSSRHAHNSQHFAIGALFREHSARHARSKSGAAEIRITLVAVDDEADRVKRKSSEIEGRMISRDELAQRFPEIARRGETAKRDDTIWLLVSHGDINVVLAQQTTDDVTRCLTLDDASKWSRYYQTTEVTNLTKKAFKDWLPASAQEGPWSETDEPWWWLMDTDVQHSWLSSHLHPLHRLFWAITTRRDNLAHFFWEQWDDPITASFLASYTYRHFKQDTIWFQDKAEEYDKFAHSLLDILHDNPNLFGRNMDSLYNEYIFFTSAEAKMHSDYFVNEQYNMLTDAERKKDAKTRSALVLMGAEHGVSVTRLDLAISAKSKAFIAHRDSQRFLDHMVRPLWPPLLSSAQTSHMSVQWFRRESGNGDWFDTNLKIRPFGKFVLKFIFMFLAWVLAWFVFLAMPTQQAPPTSWEWLFWVWCIGFLFSEFAQYWQTESLRQYWAGSGNVSDTVIGLTCLVAAVCRGVALALGDETNFGALVYQCMMFMLMVAVFAVGIRLMTMLNGFHKRLGILQM